ncbi:MAG: class I SAM-dependent methyltransferase, partial [Micromonosporaceae bacterium]
ADVYDATRGGAARGRRLAGDIRDLLLPGRTLEVGVGTGVVALGLRELGCQVAGVDIAPKMLARAYARLGGVVACGDASALPIASSSVDNVVFVHVLHLVNDLRLAVSEAARVLRPGGRMAAVHAAPEIVPDELSTVAAPALPLRHRRPDTVDAVRSAGAGVNLRHITTRFSSPAIIDETPSGLAGKYQDRVFAWLWSVDGATWQRVVAPMIAALRALPDPHRPRRQVIRTTITVLERLP